MQKRNYSAIGLLVVLVITNAGLSGCGGVALGTVIAGAAAAYDRRTTGALADDGITEIKILNAVSAERQKDPLWQQVQLSTVSYNRIVLLIGNVPSDSIRRRVVEIARSQPNAREIHDHLSIGEPLPLKVRTYDAYITAKVKAAFFLDENIESQRIKVITHRKIVYLMGLLTEDEVKAAVDKIVALEGVTSIIKVTDRFKP